MGTSTFKTLVVKKSLSPSWEEDFSITVQEPARQTQLVQLFDEDRLGKDDSLGEVSIPVSAVINAGSAGLPKQTYTLQGAGIKHGKVLLSLKFLALSVGSGGTLRASSSQSPLHARVASGQFSPTAAGVPLSS